MLSAPIIVGMTSDALLELLDTRSRTRLDSLLARNWALPGGHALSHLHGAALGPYRLIVLLGPKNNVGSQAFQVLLANEGGTLADEPVAVGLYNAGPYPAFNWVEFTRYNSSLVLAGETVDLTGGLDLELFRLVSDLVPPGGHIFVEYDSPTQQRSERTITRGYPAASSPIGYLLFQAGARSYRDWYIPEGGREGPRKLQAFKPYNDEIRAEKTAALRAELEAFVANADEVSGDEVGAGAIERAKAVLEALRKRLT